MIPTKKQLAAGQRRSLKSIKTKLIAMSVEWGDIDNYCMESLTDLANKVQEVSDNLLDQAGDSE